MMRIVCTPEAARERHRDAVRTALSRVGITRVEIARVCGVSDHLVDAWLKRGAPNCIPAWALDLLRTLYADLAPAIALELAPANDNAELALDDGTMLPVLRAFAEISGVLASPARHTPDGARTVLSTIARAEGLLSRVAPVLRALAGARRAA